MSDPQTLHFTIGPVQGFVSQARRTRDLWAGSLLLSLLSAHAMAAAIENGAVITVPDISAHEDPLLTAVQQVRSGRRDVAGPLVGSLPNRFQATVPAGFDATASTAALQAAWRQIADAVWERYLQPVNELGSGTSDIWNRQVAGFWDVSWVQAPTASSLPWLDMRKNWRRIQVDPEPGDKCTLMGDLQELSGFNRSLDRRKQDMFWKALSRRTGRLDLIDGERLSAVALIKRLFPLVAPEAIGWAVATKSWPSTSYMAASDWLNQAWQSARTEAEAFLKLLDSFQLEDIEQERMNQLHNIPDTRFARLNGRLYFSKRLYGNSAPFGKDAAGNAQAAEAAQALSRIYAVAGEPSPYYSVLLMDGDSIGALLRETGSPEKLSQALAGFTAQVASTVSRHGGVTIYAGGDDVLALLPLEGALQAAQQLRQTYRQSFRDFSSQATISAAIIMANDRTPLRTVMQTAHATLNADAKESNGRNSVAVRVMDGNAGGASWVTTWESADGQSVIDTWLIPLVNRFKGDGTPEHLRTSKNLVYNLQDRLEVLTDDEGRLPVGLNAQDIPDLILAEVRRSLDRRAKGEEAERAGVAEEVAQLLAALSRNRRGVGQGLVIEDHLSLNTDGARLARFLASRGLDGAAE